MATDESESSAPNTVEDPSEDTPLLSREDDDLTQEQPEAANNNNNATTTTTTTTSTSQPHSASLLLRSIKRKTSKKSCIKRWPSLLALLLLCIVVIIILVFAFLAPQVMKEYSAEAIEFEPTNLLIENLNSSGVLARITGTFNLDASRVKNKPVRDLGRFGTWIVRKVESRPTKVSVSFPKYNDSVIGVAEVPSIKIDIRNRHTTALDFKAFLIPGSKEAIGRVADAYIHGKLGQLHVKAQADVSFKSGLFSFPKQSLSHSLTFKANDSSAIPDYDIRSINVSEAKLPDGRKGLAAEAHIEIENPFPIGLTSPPLGFAVLIPQCGSKEKRIMLGGATIGQVHIKPNKPANLNVTGLIRRLPEAALRPCPDSSQSTLDFMVASYINGDEMTIFVQGSDSPSADTPIWLVDLIKQIIVPVDIPGRPPHDLVKEFAMEDVHFDLPGFGGELNPMVSGQINALIDIPDEINFPVVVDRIKAHTKLYYKGDCFAVLDLPNWQDASSQMVEDGNGHSDLEVRSKVDKTPINIMDSSIFTALLKEILTGSRTVNLTAKANVTADTETALGRVIIKNIPGEGQVPVNPLGGQNFSSFAPLVHNLQIVETTTDSISLQALINFTNPTPYTANVPFIDVKISVNETIIGHATAHDVSVVHGDNDNIPVEVFWEPGKEDKQGEAVGRELLSQYLSGDNVTITFKTHKDSIPSQPDLGKALSALEITLPMPRLGMPDDDDGGNGDGDGDGDDDDTRPHFIRKATMHLLSSTASFTLQSPFKKTTLYITTINATAYYKGDAVGTIDYQGSIKVAPGISESPRLPVEWSLDSVGYEAVKKALGGTLKLDAVADVGVRIGLWEEQIWFKGGGIGAHVTF